MALVESFSGVRGRFGTDLTEAVAARYAGVFHAFLQEWTGKDRPRIVIGMDPRPSSERVKRAMEEVLSEVVDLGMVSTPMCEHAVREQNADGGIMITASHNPSHDNGFKFLREDGAVLAPDRMGLIIDRFHSDFVVPDTKPTITCIPAYRSRVSYAGFLRETLGAEAHALLRERAPRVLLDPNGGAGVHYRSILENLGIPLYCQHCVAGMFTREIEPTAASLAYLQPMLSEKGAVVAAGFDCDADRVELVVQDRCVSGNEVLAMVVDAVLTGTSGETVVTNDATSGLVREIASRHDARVVEAQVGEINVVDRMLAEGALVGGEGSSSGGIIMPSRCRDGLHSLLFVLLLAARRGLTVEEILAEYPQYTNIRENLRLSPEAGKHARDRFIRFCEEIGASITEQDSVKGVLPDGSWVWMRGSKTEAGVLRVIVDSKDAARAETLLRDAVRAIHGD